MLDKKVLEFLQNYDGPEMSIMEVCGSHTEAIAKTGIAEILSDKIHLISGPGCPVCVTPSAYIDKLIELAKKHDTTVVTFGDLIRVPGSTQSLSVAKGQGASVEMVYSPLDILGLAKANPERQYVFAAVGFETTTPVYAILMDNLINEGIKNVKLLTALKTMPEVIDFVCAAQQDDRCIDGFLAPGHVSAVTGSKIFEPLAEKYSIPFGVAGFKAEELIAAIATIVKLRDQGRVVNLYPGIVSQDGNIEAQELVDKYFCKAPATWRGMGLVPESGRLLREEYSEFDAGSAGLDEDIKINKACRCSEVLMGRISPHDCPLFGKVCFPESPQGACMVSTEGSCFSYYVNHR